MKMWSLVCCLAACCVTTAVIGQSLMGDRFAQSGNSLHASQPLRTSIGRPPPVGSGPGMAGAHQYWGEQRSILHDGVERFPATESSGARPLHASMEHSSRTLAPDENEFSYGRAFDAHSQLMHGMLRSPGVSAPENGSSQFASLMMNPEEMLSGDGANWIGTHILQGSNDGSNALHNLAPTAQSQGFADGWLDSYQRRIDGVREGPRKQYDGFVAEIPDDFVPWWQAYVTRPSDANAQPI